MKLATFRVLTPVGPFDRVGAVVDRALIDVNFARASFLASKGVLRPRELADAEVPAGMIDLASGGRRALEAATESIDYASLDPEARGPRGEQIHYSLNDVGLLPPIPDPPLIRDFAGFERHLKTTFGKMGLSIPDSWYERPIAFKCNSATLIPPEATVAWPSFTDKLDYELELAAIIGVPGTNIPVANARDHIFGFTLLNDFSARDLQPKEMAMSTGPFKSKDFAFGLGPWIVTQDEIPHPDRLRMAVRVNGETWSEVVPDDMYWSFEDVVSYTSQDELLRSGDVFGSGTVTRGCGQEIDRWIHPGDVVELEAESIGILRHTIGAKTRNLELPARTSHSAASVQDD
jgi:2-keto-4-pentenoate hydratase/2-oxohepta-3-ene-1,7-dioic acid hydratase in catechol pathway